MAIRKKQSASGRGQITKTVNAKKAVEKERAALIKQLARLNAAPKETQGDKVKGNEADKLNIRLLELVDRDAELTATLQSLTDQLNSETAYGKELSGITLNQ